MQLCHASESTPRAVQAPRGFEQGCGGCRQAAGRALGCCTFRQTHRARWAPQPRRAPVPRRGSVRSRAQQRSGAAFVTPIACRKGEGCGWRPFRGTGKGAVLSPPGRRFRFLPPLGRAMPPHAGARFHISHTEAHPPFSCSQQKAVHSACCKAKAQPKHGPLNCLQVRYLPLASCIKGTTHLQDTRCMSGSRQGPMCQDHPPPHAAS